MRNLKKYLQEKLSSDPSIKKAIVFGSRAKGTASPDSDIDLLVIKTGKDSFVKRHAIIEALFRPRILPMDIIVKSPEEYKKRLKIQDPFYQEIQMSGKVVYEH